MKRYYKEYFFWEDFLNGMYETENSGCEKQINLCINLLTNDYLFLKTCKEIIYKWSISSKVHLTNKNCNRQAWIGQAACSFLYKSTELQTREAWRRLSETQRFKANEIADKIIKNFDLNYENKNYKLH